MSTYDDDEIPDLISVESSTPLNHSTTNNTNNNDEEEEFPPDLILLDDTTQQHSPSSNQDQTTEQLKDEQPPVRITPKAPVPLTILTGWLGSGKTTLLHNIVKHISTRSETVAILQNETSAFMGVEKALTLTDEENQVFGEMLEIATGCVCCSVRSDFLLAIDTLLTKRHFDYVVLECSGIADVGNLITSLWADRALSSSAGLDAVICLVDADSLFKQLAQDNHIASTTSSGDAPVYSTPLNILKNQLVYSDVAIINKLDRCLFEGLPENNVDKIEKCQENNTNLITFEQPRHLITKTTNDSTSPEIFSVLNYINTLFAPTHHASHLDLTNNSIQNAIKQVTPLSQQISIVLDYIYKVNPTLQTHFSYQSNIDIDSILKLGKYTLGSMTIPTNTLNIHQKDDEKSQKLHTITQSISATKDKPQTSYKIRDGIVVWTENKSLVPLKYRQLCPDEIKKCCDDVHHNHHEHNDDCSHHDNDCSDHHCHDKECGTDQKECDIDQNDPANDPHGISTVIITLEEPPNYSNAHDIEKGTKNNQCKSWGFDINKLTANLDEYLFGHLQRAVEEEWTIERYNFRERFHGGKETPDDIVNDLLEVQKKKKMLERQAEIDFFQQKKKQGRNNNDQNDENDNNIRDHNALAQTQLPPQSDLSKLDEATLTATLEVPQMDSIEKESVYRMKGVFSIKNRIPKWYLQSVFNTFDLLPTESLQTDEHSSLHDDIYGDMALYDQYGSKNKDLWLLDEKRYCSLIVIGVNINIERLVDLFLNSLDKD